MSTISVSTVNSANGTTNLILATGNTNAGSIVLNSNAGINLNSNSSTVALSVNSAAGINTLVNNFTIGAALYVSASGNVGINNSSPVAELHIEGNYVVKSTTLSAGNNHNINCASGNYFVVVANSSAQNVYFSSVPSSVAYSLTLRFSNGAGGNTLSWPSGTRWPSATAPSPSTNNDVYVLFTDDGGTNWRGIQSQRDSR